MPKHYPNPHPADVLEMKRPAWNYKGQPIPSAEVYGRHIEAMEMQGTAKPFEEWRAAVEAVKADNAKDKAPVIEPPEPSAPARDEASTSKPSPFADLPHRRAKDEAPLLESLSVRVKAGINDRLDRYRLDFGRVRKQEVVSDVLYAFLTFKGY